MKIHGSRQGRGRAGPRPCAPLPSEWTATNPAALLAAWPQVLLAVCLLLSISACETPPPPPLADRPNIVIVFLDDAGYGDFGVYGHPTIRTPNIDRMAAEGMRFTQFYSPSPACTASRYSLLTGRYPARSGFAWVLNPDSPRGIHADELTLAEELNAAGYATAIYGKWHLGRPQQYLPQQHGFDEYFGIPYSNDMQPPKWPPVPLVEGDEVIETDPDQTRLTREYTVRSSDFIRRHRDEPFFLYLPHSMPHIPLHAGPEFAGRSARGIYGDVIEELDWSVGRILDTLRQEGLAEQTFVFLTSDNGPWIIKNELGGSAGLLRDGKGSTWEGGVREPAIAWWPGTVPAGVIERSVASTMDLYATALSLAGQPLPEDRSVDGRDISALLRGEPHTPRTAPFFYYGPRQEVHAVRRGPWKLHVLTYSQTGLDYFEGKLPLLFNLGVDPSEQWDVAEQHPEVVAELLALIEAHQAEVFAEGSFFDREGQ